MVRLISQISFSLLSFLIVITLCSCGEPSKTPREKAEKFINHLNDGNTDALKQMLCERLKNRDDIAEELQELVNLLEGNIISYELTGGGGSGSWSREGNRVVEHGGGRDITTDRGNIYRLTLHMYKENDFDLDLIGIYSIFFAEINQDNIGTDWFLNTIEIEV